MSDGGAGDAVRVERRRRLASASARVTNPRGGLARGLRRRVRNLRISTKIVSVSLIVASIFAAVGLIGLLSVRDLAAQQDQQYRVNVLALSHMTAVRGAVSLQQEAVLAHILSEPGFYRERLAQTVVETDASIDREIAQLRLIGLDRAERNGLTAFERTLAMWRSARNTALDASRAGDQAKATSIMLVRSEAIGRAIKERADAFLNQLVDAVAAGTKQSRADSEDTGRLMLLLLVAGGVVAVALSILAARTISRPLRRTVDVLAKVARGDLTHRLDIDSDDEIGQMGRSLNETLGVLRGAFDQLHHRASHDGLTGLANRTLLRERLAQARDRALSGVPVGVLLIDLDGFKQVNDVHGHAAGDFLLQVVAQRLTDGVRTDDTVARLGGDEFAVLLDGVEESEDVFRVAERLLASVQRPADFDGVELGPRASVGATVWNGQSEIDRLMHDADVAMYAAKVAGKGTVVRFSEETAQLGGSSPEPRSTSPVGTTTERPGPVNPPMRSKSSSAA